MEDSRDVPNKALLVGAGLDGQGGNGVGRGYGRGERSPMTVFGIDISDAQGEIPDVQWQAIAVDKRYVICESRIGNNGNSKNFTRYVAGARAAGMTVGAYLYAYCLPDDPAHPGRSPEDQAQAFFEAAGGLGGNPGELAPVIDLEFPAPEAFEKWGCDPGMVADWAVRCAAKVKSLFNRKPMIYTYPYWGKTVPLTGLVDCPLWLATYGGSTYKTISPWLSASMLQTGAGTYRLPNGSPCDEDSVADEATFAMLTGR
jgi:GH25 family lysozyme M1 (1,4-beta-N-acetylmuramidase)